MYWDLVAREDGDGFFGRRLARLEMQMLEWQTDEFFKLVNETQL